MLLLIVLFWLFLSTVAALVLGAAIKLADQGGPR